MEGLVVEVFWDLFFELLGVVFGGSEGLLGLKGHELDLLLFLTQNLLGLLYLIFEIFDNVNYILSIHLS